MAKFATEDPGAKTAALMVDAANGSPHALIVDKTQPP